jgi:hypothetical protein
MTVRRLIAMTPTMLASSVLVAGLLTTTSPQAVARTADDACLGQRPIPVRALPALDAAGCSLVGRTVTDGHASVVVPAAGMGVVGDGLSRHGDAHGLAVANSGGSVSVVHPGAADSRRAERTILARRDPGACQDRTFHLEGNKWGSRMRFAINPKGMPKRLKKKTVIKQIRIANGNMRKGRNNCHKKRLKTPASHYTGRTRTKPNIKMHGPTCAGHPDKKSVVGFGNLPGGLLGWTCYWYYLNNRRIAASDIMMDNGKYLVTKLPKGCRAKWDFEGATTHEWGHAYGMAHTGSGHSNLTMQHVLSPCSPYARTLGLGDWLGMNKMYGHRH